MQSLSSPCISQVTHLFDLPCFKTCKILTLWVLSVVCLIPVLLIANIMLHYQTTSHVSSFTEAECRWCCLCMILLLSLITPYFCNPMLSPWLPSASENLGIAAFIFVLLALILNLAVFVWLRLQRPSETVTTSNTAAEGREHLRGFPFGLLSICSVDDLCVPCFPKGFPEHDKSSK